MVFDQVMTDTAMYGDIILPATTFLEQRDVRAGYGAYVVGGVRPVIEPEGEAKSNIEVFAALGRAMGWRDDAFTWDQGKVLEKVTMALDMGGGSGLAELAAGNAVPLRFDGTNTPIMFGNVFPATADGKVHLTPRQLGSRPFAYDSVSAVEYPFALVSPATSKTVSSTLGEFNLAELFVDVHPRDAEPLGIEDGTRVRVFNDLGEVLCWARVRETVRPGVVAIPKGAWRIASANGQTATALCPATVGDVGGGACFNDARVGLEPA